VQQVGYFDISLQVTVPNEFEKIAPVNVGYTAGIETTKVSPQWIAKSNETVDKIIVVSNHSKKVFEQTKYDVKDQAGNEHKEWGLQDLNGAQERTWKILSSGLWKRLRMTRMWV
jgi:hypothetical protein